jgi:hypothetical protein
MANTVKKEWTIMFYFASDNPLAPGIVSQLKAIKDAGFHPDVNVVAQFDPHARTTEAHIFDINFVEKLKVEKLRAPRNHRVGFANDPFVRNLVLDRLWGEKDQAIKDGIAQSLKEQQEQNQENHPEWYSGMGEYNPPTPDDKMLGEQNPTESLANFLDFCQREYPAFHYILFILGHGVVVGNDLFLFDEHAPLAFRPQMDGDDPQKETPGGNVPDQLRKLDLLEQHSLTLTDLGRVLNKFCEGIKGKGELELLGFHSCSMSGLEVAYELQGTAKYLLASQGPAFVGSWPYKNILMRLFNYLIRDEEESLGVKGLLTKIAQYCLYNSYDFQLAGYSFDLCLSDLTKITSVTEPVQALSSALVKSLVDGADPVAKGLILLAHWEAQSYWQESYTDLYDFCFRLNLKCENADQVVGATSAIRDELKTACNEVMDTLKRGVNGNDELLIVRAQSAGPSYQYSHGFSVFFPWSRPADDFFEEKYKKYMFSETSWHKFLDAYFEKTKRGTHRDELKDDRERELQYVPGDRDRILLDKITTVIFNETGQLSKGGGGDVTSKGGGGDPAGDDCSCPSIKNYPSSTGETSPVFFNGDFVT